MTMAKKSLIVAIFFFVASLPAQASNREAIATPLQVLGAIVLVQGKSVYYMGNKLIQNGYGDINLDTMPSYLKKPKAMKKFGLACLPLGLATLASPLIFEKLEKLGEQHREDKWKEKMAQVEKAEKNKSDRS